MRMERSDKAVRCMSKTKRTNFLVNERIINPLLGGLT